MDIPFDYVVAVCSNAEETCPVFPGNVAPVRRLFDDPPKLEKEVEGEEEKLNCYRRVRDEIKAYILTLPVSLEKEVVRTKIGESVHNAAQCDLPTKSRAKKNVSGRSLRLWHGQRIRAL